MDAVRIRFVTFSQPADDDRVLITGSYADNGTPWIKHYEGYFANPGAYLNRDDVVAFIRELKDQAPQGADARSWLEAVAIELSSRGG